tara:strand:+ start:811 stop:1695 length:885 start_codon:yes stop_codon:yes gene_type:complete
MLPRRHIRIKVFQSLYSISHQNDEQNFNINHEFKANLDSYLNLFQLVVDLLRITKEIAKSEINIKKQKLIPSDDDLKPNQRFIHNKILSRIKNKYHYSEQEYEKIRSAIKSIFQQIKTSKQYVKYMNHNNHSIEEDKKIVLYILKNYIIINEKIHNIIEDYSIYWNDDLIIVYNMLLEKINNNQSLNHTKLFRQPDDRLFANTLWEKTIKNKEKTSKIIYELAKNWDKERIAISDLIIMRMAITEMTYIQNIPHKVTLDEYIEISKQYSTPKSKEFINGILDVFIKEILLKKNK